MSATGPGFAAEDLSLFARIQRVFYAPSTAFAAVRGQESAHDWLLPALLVCAVGVGCYNLTLDVGAPAVQEQLEAWTRPSGSKQRRSKRMAGWWSRWGFFSH